MFIYIHFLYYYCIFELTSNLIIVFFYIYCDNTSKCNRSLAFLWRSDGYIVVIFDFHAKHGPQMLIKEQIIREMLNRSARSYAPEKKEFFLEVNST